MGNFVTKKCEYKHRWKLCNTLTWMQMKVK
uniref:Uncharacterized protein n=1 Tax=Tetranychus urticae TaxID=32264 RepID=T1L1K1_TETUR